MTEEQLRAAVSELSENGRVPCQALLDLARRTGASPAEIGRICDELPVKITRCQLGCFG